MDKFSLNIVQSIHKKVDATRPIRYKNNEDHCRLDLGKVVVIHVFHLTLFDLLVRSVFLKKEFNHFID